MLSEKREVKVKMNKFWKKTCAAGVLASLVLGTTGCFYGMNSYGQMRQQIKTTAAADTLEDTLITDFRTEDGMFQFKDLSWGSSKADLEAMINLPVSATTAFTDGAVLGDINYSVKLMDYISVGMQPIFDGDGGLTSLSIYFEKTYSADQLSEIFEKAKEAAAAAFGPEDLLQTENRDNGNMEYVSTTAFWYNQIDEHTMNTLQIGKLDQGNGTEAVVIGVNIYDPTLIEEESTEVASQTAEGE